MALLPAQIVGDGCGLLKDLGRHDSGANGQQHTAAEAVNGLTENTEIDATGAPQYRAACHGMHKDDVVAYARVNRERNSLAPGGGCQRVLTVRMGHSVSSAVSSLC